MGRAFRRHRRAYEVFVGQPEGKRPLRRFGRGGRAIQILILKK
jgi:hypothetical protein